MLLVNDFSNITNTEETIDRKYRLQEKGYDFSTFVDRVAELLRLSREDVLSPGKYKKVVEARSVVCC
jgi:chromosomal replication initiation ATPase DnaA